MLYVDRSSEGEQSYYFFVSNEKYVRGRRLKFKIHILFYGDNSRTAALIQM
jgi:hypothetical protein